MEPYLHGARIDVAQDAWSVYDAVQAMLRTSPVAEAEEWAMQGLPGSVKVSEDGGKARVEWQRPL